MITKKLTIQNKLGIHARPAAQFVRVASRFQADVSVEKFRFPLDQIAFVKTI